MSGKIQMLYIRDAGNRMLTEQERQVSHHFSSSADRIVSLPSLDSPSGPHCSQAVLQLPLNLFRHLLHSALRVALGTLPDSPRSLLWLRSLQSIELAGCFCAPTCLNVVPFSVLPALWCGNYAFIGGQRTDRTGTAAAEPSSPHP